MYQNTFTHRGWTSDAITQKDIERPLKAQYVHVFEAACHVYVSLKSFSQTGLTLPQDCVNYSFHSSQRGKALNPLCSFVLTSIDFRVSVERGI